MKPGIVYAPWKIITTKAIISDKNGTRSYWQINKWQRFKYFIYRILHKSKRL